jgi:nicotinate-nucleotide adenylyltransferase
MAGKLRLGLFGGSFDPVHRGHLQLARAAQNAFHLERVLFIPARKPPHKKDRVVSPAAQRLRMLSIALRPYPGLGISRFELRRTATTYTYQTVEYFRKRYPGAKIFFIIGSDSLAELSTWKNAEHLFSLCEFIVGKRAGFTGATIPRQAVVRFLPHLLPAVSSSLVRRNAAAGHSILKLVPPGVERYIERTGIYKEK